VPSWPKGSDNRFSTINARAETVADIVTDANTRFAPVHDRMPVILDPADYETWLDPDAMDKAALLELLRPFDPRGWTAYPVSRAVNSPRNDSPALLAPAPVPSAKTSADATAPRRFRG
jgi:putative SOS response-associated peptidase YedK